MGCFFNEYYCSSLLAKKMYFLLLLLSDLLSSLFLLNLSSIDLTQPDKTIFFIIKNNTFERSQNKILEARNKCLNQYNLFSLITNFIEKKEEIRRKQAKKNKIKIKHIACTSPNFFAIAKKSISTDHEDNYDVLKQYYSMVCRKQGLKGKLSFIKNFGLKNYFKIKTW